MNYKPYLIFSSIMAAGILAIFLVSQGYYPIAMVQGSFVSAKTFTEEYRAASFSYQNALKAYGSVLQNSSTLTQADLQAGVMDQIIENDIIKNAAQKEAGSALDGLVQSKVGQYANDEALAKASVTLYGLDQKALIADVLVPTATKDILAGRLTQQGIKFDDWLASAKKSAQVIIFSSQFRWDGAEVKAM